MRPDVNTTIHDTVRFRPSRVEGLSDVDEVCVTREALEIIAGGRQLTFPYLDFARGREISSGRVPVGELHFSKVSYPDSHVVFYTTPRIAIYMPVDGPTRTPHSHFWRIQEVLRAGGFKLYDGGPPEPAPIVLDMRPTRTAMYVLMVLALAWLYAMIGFAPEPVGGTWRRFLFSNPRNPAIGLAFMLPAIVVPLLLGFRHGRRPWLLVVFMMGSFALATASQWALRHTISSWAALDQGPFSMPFWSARRSVGNLIVVVVASLGGATYRRAFLEPILKTRCTPRPSE